MRLAWFSPLPPVRSGIASYSAEVLPLLAAGFDIDCFDAAPDPAGTASSAHDFVWKARLKPYDLIVYQLGNAPCHDYMWAYMPRYPGMVVLHDARLHHARARQLLRARREDDYRQEFQFDHPDAPPGAPDYAIEGLSGTVYYLWPMLRAVLRTARLTVVHSQHVAAELAAEYAGAPIDAIRMGVPLLDADSARAARVRRDIGIADGAIVFAAFGKVTAEKRIGPILAALQALVDEGTNAHLLVIGEPSDGVTIDTGRLGGRIHVVGYVPDDRLGAYLGAADVCLCLRWPTAQESSASWLRALAARRPTVVTALAHLGDVPTIDARTWHGPSDPVAIAIDLLTEDESLLSAMRKLAADAKLRDSLAAAGFDHWNRHHRLELMADDYRRVLTRAAALPAPRLDGLPRHLTQDYGELSRSIAQRFGVSSPFE